MTPAFQEIVNKLGLSFDAAFAKWVGENMADIAALQMTAGSVLGITVGLKQSLITILSQQAGSAVPVVVPVDPDVTPAPIAPAAPAVPIPVVIVSTKKTIPVRVEKEEIAKAVVDAIKGNDVPQPPEPMH